MTAPIRLVLDTSAVLAYARGSIHVGELLGEVLEEGVTAAVPVTCLAEAFPAAVESGMLHALTAHPAALVVADDARQWQALGEMCALVEGIAAASAALLTVDADCYVLTARPELYEHVSAGEFVIRIPD